MKVLFIRSGNDGNDPISTNQGESIARDEVSIIYFDIIGKGIIGYLRNIFTCRKYIKKHQPDLIHAHYSLSGFISSLTFLKIPIGVSLMGSDVNDSSKLMKLLLKLFSRFIWSFTIVKSDEMYKKLNEPRILIIPNGVDLNSFFPMDTDLAQEKLGWKGDIKHIIFASDPERPEKNFELAKKALYLLQKEQIKFQMHFLKNIIPADMVLYYNAADVLLMTSLYEGSPNVIKEAMACNCPIVATDVGDVKTILGKTKNTFITSFSPYEIQEILLSVLAKAEKTDGRSHIGHLDSKLIAKKLTDLYKETLKHD